MTLEARIVALAQAIGGDVKLLNIAKGDLTSLTTTAKNSLVAAINELHTLLGSAGTPIDDAAGNGDTAVTWSADKISDTIAAAMVALKNELTDGAAAALDTFADFAAALDNDPSFAATIAAELTNRVRFDAPQVLTAEQKAQACANIGVGNPERDYVGDYAAAKA